MTLLDEALAFQGSKLLQPGKVVLIKDCVATSGTFILHYLIKKMLMGSSEIAMGPKARAQKVSPTVGAVLFIGLNEPFVHYERILRKLGCNLLAYRDNNQFIFMDMLHADYTGGKVTKAENALFELYKSIHQTLQECISSEKKTGGVCIMIDDLSLLEIVAHGSEDHVLDFLHYCRILTSEQGCSLVLLSHQDIYASMDNSSFIRHLEYFADIVIDVEPLNSGLAADVHGQLTVLHRSSHKDISNMGSGSINMLHNFHFRVKENQVEYFLPGKQF